MSKVIPLRLRRSLPYCLVVPRRLVPPSLLLALLWSLSASWFSSKHQKISLAAYATSTIWWDTLVFEPRYIITSTVHVFLSLCTFAFTGHKLLMFFFFFVIVGFHSCVKGKGRSCWSWRDCFLSHVVSIWGYILLYHLSVTKSHHLLFLFLVLRIKLATSGALCLRW